MGDDIDEAEYQMIRAAENQWAAAVALLALGEKLRDSAAKKGQEHE